MTKRTGCQRGRRTVARVCTPRSTWRSQAARAARGATCHLLVEHLLLGLLTARRYVSGFCLKIFHKFRPFFTYWQYLAPSPFIYSNKIHFPRWLHSLSACSVIERARSQRDPRSLNDGDTALNPRARKMPLRTREAISSGLVNFYNFNIILIRPLPFSNCHSPPGHYPTLVF